MKVFLWTLLDIYEFEGLFGNLNEINTLLKLTWQIENVGVQKDISTEYIRLMTSNFNNKLIEINKKNELSFNICDFLPRNPTFLF